MVPAALAALLSLVLVAPRPARAAGEAEWQLSGRLGLAGINVNRSGCFPGCDWGPAAAVDLEYGFTDAWAARVSVGGSSHGVDPQSSAGATASRVTATTALVGATYTFDVLRLVPYATLGVGLVHFAGVVPELATRAAGEVGLGAQYYLNPRWTCGASLQYLVAPNDLLNFEAPFYTFSFTVRLSRMFF